MQGHHHERLREISRQDLGQWQAVLNVCEIDAGIAPWRMKQAASEGPCCLTGSLSCVQPGNWRWPLVSDPNHVSMEETFSGEGRLGLVENVVHCTQPLISILVTTHVNHVNQRLVEASIFILRSHSRNGKVAMIHFMIVCRLAKPEAALQTQLLLISRPGRSQGLLYKHLRH